MGILDMFKKKDESPANIDGINNTDAMLSDVTGMPHSNTNSDFNYGMEQNMNQPAANLSTMMDNNYGQQNGFPQHSQAPMQQSMSSQSSMQQLPQTDMTRDLQMISLKLDAIKSELDAMNQRLRNVEMIAEKEQVAQQQKKWY
jgi:hypothetical protein